MIYSINGQKFDSNFLEHYGVKGQKWGVRRYQNTDGSWTEAGKERRREEREFVDRAKKSIKKELASQAEAEAATDAIYSTKLSKKRIEDIIASADQRWMKEHYGKDGPTGDDRRIAAISELIFRGEVPKEYYDAEDQFRIATFDWDKDVAELRDSFPSVYNYKKLRALVTKEYSKKYDEYLIKQRAKYEKMFADFS